MMKSAALLSALVLSLALFAVPVLAQVPAPSAPPARTLSMPTLPPQGVSAGHAVALGAGMFAGAVLGSALINGGALAAAIGAVAGLSIGHYAWTERQDLFD